MKKTIKGIVIGIIISIMLMSTVLGAQVKKSIEVVYNSVNLTVNGTKVNADNFLYEGTTYVPLRAVAEALGKNVGWNQDTFTASINDKTDIPEPLPVPEPVPAPAPAPTPELKPNDNYTFGSSFVYDAYCGKFKVNIGQNYSFDTIKNRYSDNNGDAVIRIPVTVENIGTETGYFYNGHISGYNSLGNLTSLSIRSYFDDGRNIHDSMRPGAKASGAIYILYSGDGKYYLTFENTTPTSIELELPINK